MDLGTFYYLCSILDGTSRSIDHYEIREPMTEQDGEIIVTSRYSPHSTSSFRA